MIRFLCRSRRQRLAPLTLVIASSLVAVLPGCSRAGARQATPARGAPSVPAVFERGVVSDTREQWRITFTPDGRTAYFASSAGFFPVTRQSTIHVSTFVEGAWTVPAVAPFSGTYSDIDPALSPDGRRLYFSSIRPVGGATRGDIDIWYVDRTPKGWSEPVRLGDEVNSTGDELYPSISADGTLYFASGPRFPQPGQHFDIYSAKRSGAGFSGREALGAGVNTIPVSGGGLQDAWEFNPEITADGKTLLFTSLRPGGYGLGDLYVSHLVNGTWSAARNLGPAVNTAADEYHPTLSRDGQVLYFVRRGPNPGDFYRVAAKGII